MARRGVIEVNSALFAHSVRLSAAQFGFARREPPRAEQLTLLDMFRLGKGDVVGVVRVQEDAQATHACTIIFKVSHQTMEVVHCTLYRSKSSLYRSKPILYRL